MSDPVLFCRATAISGGIVKSVLCFAGDCDVQSVTQAVEELFQLGLGAECREQGLKILIDLAPGDRPELMHDADAIFRSLHGGQLDAALGCKILKQPDHRVGNHDAVDREARLGGVAGAVNREACLALLGAENVTTARVVLELRLQEDEANGAEWEPAMVAAYHRLCWLEGIRGYDELPLSHVEAIAREMQDRGLSVCTWIQKRIQRGAAPALRDTSRDTPRHPGESKPVGDQVASGKPQDEMTPGSAGEVKREGGEA